MEMIHREEEDDDEKMIEEEEKRSSRIKMLSRKGDVKEKTYTEIIRPLVQETIRIIERQSEILYKPESDLLYSLRLYMSTSGQMLVNESVKYAGSFDKSRHFIYCDSGRFLIYESEKQEILFAKSMKIVCPPLIQREKNELILIELEEKKIYVVIMDLVSFEMRKKSLNVDYWENFNRILAREEDLLAIEISNPSFKANGPVSSSLMIFSSSVRIACCGKPEINYKGYSCFDLEFRKGKIYVRGLAQSVDYNSIYVFYGAEIIIRNNAFDSYLPIFTRKIQIGDGLILHCESELIKMKDGNKWNFELKYYSNISWDMTVFWGYVDKELVVVTVSRSSSKIERIMDVSEWELIKGFSLSGVDGYSLLWFEDKQNKKVKLAIYSMNENRISDKVILESKDRVCVTSSRGSYNQNNIYVISEESGRVIHKLCIFDKRAEVLMRWIIRDRKENDSYLAVWLHSLWKDAQNMMSKSIEVIILHLNSADSAMMVIGKMIKIVSDKGLVSEVDLFFFSKIMNEDMWNNFEDISISDRHFTNLVYLQDLMMKPFLRLALIKIYACGTWEMNFGFMNNERIEKSSDEIKSILKTCHYLNLDCLYRIFWIMLMKIEGNIMTDEDEMLELN